MGGKLKITYNECKFEISKFFDLVFTSLMVKFYYINEKIERYRIIYRLPVQGEMTNINKVHLFY